MFRRAAVPSARRYPIFQHSEGLGRSSFTAQYLLFPTGGPDAENAMLRRCRRIVHFLVHCTLHVGRDPQKVEPPALILLPSLPATLFCGLAGILTLRIPGRVPETSRPTPRNDISSLFRQAAERGLSAILRGTGTDAKPFSVEAYLGGLPVQQSMERELLRMKGEEAFAVIFYDEGEVRRLALLFEEMKSFLADEEAILEAQAWRIPTADLETINRGLELIRDLIWWLDRDILENVGKIRLLAGADRSADVAREALPKYRKLNFLLNSLDRLEERRNLSDRICGIWPGDLFERADADK